MCMKRLYCGGRFYFDCRKDQYEIQAAEDYRSKLLGGVDKMLHGRGELVINDDMSYVGPYYFETEDMAADDIVAIELDMIDRCTDAVFVLDEADCPGTITELLYAATKRKQIYIFYKEYPQHDETESELHTPCWFPILATMKLANVAIYSYDDYSLLAQLIFDKIMQ